MMKAYEVTYKVGNELKAATVKGYTLIGAVCKLSNWMDENEVSINEISFERYHALNTAYAIREAVLIEAAKKLNVEI